MERNELIAQYDKYLCAFCRESAYLEDIAYRRRNGRVVSEKELVSHLSVMRDSREALIKTKLELGFEGGIEFTDDCNFLGFKYRNGVLSGDYTKLPAIILPWISEFDESRVYSYEVGILILCHYMMQKKRAKKERRRRCFRQFILRVQDVVCFLLGVKKEDFSYE